MLLFMNKLCVEYCFDVYDFEKLYLLIVFWLLFDSVSLYKSGRDDEDMKSFAAFTMFSMLCC